MSILIRRAFSVFALMILICITRYRAIFSAKISKSGLASSENILSRLQEQELRSRGYAHIIGVDEAGRGPLAGPVVCSGVISLNPTDVIPGVKGMLN